MLFKIGLNDIPCLILTYIIVRGPNFVAFAVELGKLYKVISKDNVQQMTHCHTIVILITFDPRGLSIPGFMGMDCYDQSKRCK